MIFRYCTAPIYEIRIFLVSVEATCIIKQHRDRLIINAFCANEKQT